MLNVADCFGWRCCGWFGKRTERRAKSRSRANPPPLDHHTATTLQWKGLDRQGLLRLHNDVANQDSSQFAAAPFTVQQNITKTLSDGASDVTANSWDEWFFPRVTLNRRARETGGHDTESFDTVTIGSDSEATPR
jgi:hypothetical protein